MSKTDHIEDGYVELEYPVEVVKMKMKMKMMKGRYPGVKTEMREVKSFQQKVM